MRGFHVRLTDGREFYETDFHGSTPAWIQLKSIVEGSSAKIAEISLVFDHQKVSFRNHAPVYFYAKKVEAWLDLSVPQTHFYGIGTLERPGEVEITWYDGVNSQIENRKIEKGSIQFIFNT